MTPCVRGGAPRTARPRLPALGALAVAALAASLAEGGCVSPPSRRPALRQVVIRDMRFEPVELTLAPGDTVEWTNRDLVPHTATAQARVWNSGTIVADASWRAIVRTPGAYPYVCLFHPGMQARLVVR